MREIKLEAKGAEQEAIKAYLRENASEVLAAKINNGVYVEKDGKRLLNKKDLDGFMSFASDEARKQAEKGARFACIKSDVVFGWAIHYFEEDDIIGKLYNEDGSEYHPTHKHASAAVSAPSAVIKKEESGQLSLFDDIPVGESIPIMVNHETGEVLDDTEECCEAVSEPQERGEFDEVLTRFFGKDWVMV